MKRMLFLVVVLCAFYSGSYAQNSDMKSSGFITDILADLNYVQGEVIQLIGAMPDEKFGWRPADSVRSVSEVYMHIAGSNYFLSTFFGGKMPADFKQDMEKTVTKKAEIIEHLKKSYAFVKDVISKYNEKDLDKPVDFFGNKMNQRRMILLLVYHSHEHLGQAIAYARMNGVTPPWSVATK